MFSWLKDKGVQFAAKTFVNSQYGRFGKMTQLRIDSVGKTIDLELALKGEAEPIKVHVSGYELKTGNDGSTFSAAEVAVSREWMNLLAAEFLKDKPLRIPAAAAKWLRLAL